MKILVDADGCPVVDITVRAANSRGIKCVIICDTAHRIERENAETITVSTGADSADFRLVNLIEKGDIVVTQDYGLAAMCLGKNAIVTDQNGFVYTDENISGLLEFRALHKKIMRGGGRFKGAPKRTKEQDKAFEITLGELLDGHIS